MRVELLLFGNRVRLNAVENINPKFHRFGRTLSTVILAAGNATNFVDFAFTSLAGQFAEFGGLLYLTSHFRSFRFDVLRK